MVTPFSIALAARDLSNAGLADIVGCSSAWIGELAQGRGRPSDGLAQRIADVLDVDPAELFADETDAVVIAFVRRTTATSGVPAKLEDPAAAERIALILRSQEPGNATAS